jgi:magnesium-transporting ATPase (P-type)
MKEFLMDVLYKLFLIKKEDVQFQVENYHNLRGFRSWRKGAFIFYLLIFFPVFIIFMLLGFIVLDHGGYEADRNYVFFLYNLIFLILLFMGYLKGGAFYYKLFLFLYNLSFLFLLLVYLTGASIESVPTPELSLGKTLSNLFFAAKTLILPGSFIAFFFEIIIEVVAYTFLGRGISLINYYNLPYIIANLLVIYLVNRFVFRALIVEIKKKK